MKDMGRITASQAWAQPVIVKPDYVYVHTNIESTEDPEGNTVYSMNEMRYTHEEYIGIIGNENAELSDTVNSILTDILPGILEA